ncbi:MAG: lysophospholipid acyltransferase family protein [Vicinamibacterales bacterium]
MLLLPPLRLCLLLTRDERTAYRLVQRCARAALRLVGCRVSVRHVERVPTDGPVMFVSNHVSLADAAVLLAFLPFDLRFVSNHVFAQYPLLGAAIRAASAHIVDRASWRSRAECGHAMTHALSTGRSLLVFPEGTTSDDGRLRAFRSGAFRAAARSGRPVVPIAIHGTRAMFPPDTYWLSNVEVNVELLPSLEARDASRAAVHDLKARSAAAIQERIDSGLPPV